MTFFPVNFKPWKTEFLNSRKEHLPLTLSGYGKARCRSLIPVPIASVPSGRGVSRQPLARLTEESVQRN